jgi:hypothetical protein
MRDFIRRQRTWAVLLEGEVETAKLVAFAHETLDDLTALP